MEELVKNTLGQLGALGILIWFLFHLYHRMEKRLEQREKIFDQERSHLMDFYENKIQEIVRHNREDATRHQADRDDWFESYFKLNENLSETLKHHTQAMSEQNSLLAGCPHNQHGRLQPFKED